MRRRSLTHYQSQNRQVKGFMLGVLLGSPSGRRLLRRYTRQTIKIENFGLVNSFACGCGGGTFLGYHFISSRKQCKRHFLSPSLRDDPLSKIEREGDQRPRFPETERYENN